jgi:OmpA-OmpF porin, OOP family
MRGVVGLAVLALGLLGLGYYAYGKSAVEIENAIVAGATEAVASAIHGVVPDVRGRDIRLTGLADSEAERAALMAAANGVAGRRLVIDDMTVLPVASPFVARLTKGAAPQALIAAGVVPSARVQKDLAAAGWGEGVASLALAAGAPVTWVALAKAGAAALRPLETGEITVMDNRLAIKGVAFSPAEYAQMQAALSGLPADAVTLDVTQRDDGTPNDFVLTYDVTRGAEVSGKLPPGLTIFSLAEALGLPEIAGASAVKEGLMGPPGNIGPFASLSRYLPLLEGLQVNASPQGVQIAAQTGLGIDADALRADLQSDIGADVALTVTQADDTGMNGDTRTNAATGLAQRYAGGYWIAVPTFAADRAVCQTETQAVLDADTINFQSGSDVLEADSILVLNRLAEVVIYCAEAAQLRAVIGGHTDSSGDALANLGLSQKRATAVRLALVARGVPAPALKAIGFGAEQPIASNDTEDGKALNRRTTIDWVE